MKQVRTRGKQLRPLLDAVKWVLLWITVALAAAAMIWSALGQELALQFLGGYLIELSLSMDNLFVFMSIFTAFGIAEHARHRGAALGHSRRSGATAAVYSSGFGDHRPVCVECCICLEHCWWLTERKCLWEKKRKKM